MSPTSPEYAEAAVALLLGLGLAAAAGFRVFVPLLVAAVGAWAGHLDLAAEFAWVGSPVTVAALSVATAFEVAAAKIPWVDNLLDTLAVPASVVAGTLLTAAFVADLSPMLRWGLAIVAGGGMAGGIASGMAVLRAGSTVTTGGVANPVLAVAETGASVGVSLLTVVLPVAGLLIAAAFATWFDQRRRRAARGRSAEKS